MSQLMKTESWPCLSTPAGSWTSAPWTKFILSVCGSTWHLIYVSYSMVSTGITIKLFVLTTFFYLVFRSVIEKRFYRYHDLQAGQIVEVRIKLHH